MGICSHGFVALFVTLYWFSFMFYMKKKNERKEERDIKYNEKDTFIPIFNNEKGKVGCGCLTEGISIGDLSDNF